MQRPPLDVRSIIKEKSIRKAKGENNVASNKLIVIEGLDGSGKATQARRLMKALMEQGVSVREVSFPDYDSDSSALVRMYLSGQFGTDPQDVNAYAASSFFAVDRFASYRKDWSRDYAKGVVIADRYTTSNAVHQCSKLPRQQWESFLDWLFDFEYNKLGIPVPDCVIYLNVDPQVSQALMTARYSGDESKKDIHERDLAYLKHSREAAQYCAEKLGWLTVDCCRDGQMLPIEEIHKRIMRLIEKCI